MAHRGSSILLLAAVGVLACSGTNSPYSSGSGAGAAPSDASTPNDTGASSGAPATWTDVYTNVISKRCAPCHTASDGIGVTQGQLDMASQSTAYTNLVGAAAAGSACAGKGTRVVAGQPDMSIMYLKVSLDDPAPCGAKMPRGGPPLTQDQADMVESWITAGAKND